MNNLNHSKKMNVSAKTLNETLKRSQKSLEKAKVENAALLKNYKHLKTDVVLLKN